MVDQKFLESLDRGLCATQQVTQTESIQLEPPHRQRELSYMKRLGKRHMAGWPSKKTYPRYKI